MTRWRGVEAEAAILAAGLDAEIRHRRMTAPNEPISVSELVKERAKATLTDALDEGMRVERRDKE